VVIGWTGHRPELFADPEMARLVLLAAAAEALRLWPSAEFVCGGQRGVDMWAADAARDITRFHLVLPASLESFTADWSEADRANLKGLASIAASVAVTHSSVQAGPLAYDLRNEAVARRSDLLVAGWTGLRKGGTFFTIADARQLGRPVLERVLRANPTAELSGRGV